MVLGAVRKFIKEDASPASLEQSRTEHQPQDSFGQKKQESGHAEFHQKRFPILFFHFQQSIRPVRARLKNPRAINP
jgi:hypothetical protein